MATPIYKISSYVDWKSSPSGLVKSGGGSGGNTIIQTPASPSVDLSNYYTKSDLQTEGSAEVNFNNLINTNHNSLEGLQGGDSDDFYHLDYTEYVRLVSLTFQGSLYWDVEGGVTLLGDNSDPDPGMYYGTDENSNRGWHSLPSGATNYWDRNGTDLSPINAGDDLLIPNGDLIKFGDGDTYIYENNDDELLIYIGGDQALQFVMYNGAVSVYFDVVGQLISWPGDKWVMEPQSGGSIGLSMEIRTGEGSSAHGNMYLMTKIGSETAGNYYLGSGSAGNLPAKGAETNVVYYDPSTGKLSYGTP